MFTFNLIPVNDLLEVSTSGKFIRYKSLGNDPQFKVNIKRPLPKGWYEISIPFKTAKGAKIKPRLYYSFDGIFSEQDSISLLHSNSNLIRELIYLPSEIKHLRFDPTNQQLSEFRVSTVKITEVSDTKDIHKIMRSKSLSIPLNKIIPANDIEIVASSNGSIHYRSIGCDPNLNIDLDSPLPKNWYELTISVKDIVLNIMYPRLYFNTGKGFNEEESVLLPQPEKDQIKWLIYLPSNVYQFRLDPTTEPGEFSIHNIELKSLSRYAAALKKFKALQYKTKTEKNNATLTLLKAFTKQGLPGIKKELWDGAILTAPVSVIGYNKWVALYDTIKEKDISKMKQKVIGFKYKPLISIIVPIYNPDLIFLEKAIKSVLNQVYSHWELCLADDASPNEDVKKILKSYSKKDSRIKVIFREKNGHISEASNSAISIATGEYIALLDQDDELRPHSLYMIAKELNKDRNLCLLFSDEDKIDKNSHRFNAYFKPEWSLDLLYGQNYVSHLGVYKTSIVKEIGGFRKGYEGSQDYDLVLRFIEKIKPTQIKKINAVLYHWRAIPGSTALAAGSKLYAYDSAVRAIQDHLDRTKQNAMVYQLPGYLGLYRVKYSLPSVLPKVSLIIPTKDKVDILDNCIQSIIKKTTYSNYEIIIIDNDSKEEKSKIYFKKLEQKNQNIKVISYKKPFNYSAINNLGVQNSKGSILGFINNDIEIISEDWLEEMVSHALRKEVGAVGAKLYFSNNTVQHAGLIVGLGGVAGHILKHTSRTSPGYFGRALLTQNFSAITAACIIMRKELFEKVGGFNEKDLKVAYNDVDLCLKLRENGYLILWTPFAELYHLESISRGLDDTPEKIARFKSEIQYMEKTWKTHELNDPYFNPNLDKHAEDYGLAFPEKKDNYWEEN